MRYAFLYALKVSEYDVIRQVIKAKIKGKIVCNSVRYANHLSTLDMFYLQYQKIDKLKTQYYYSDYILVVFHDIH
jgi:hypothetical protein